MTLLTLCAAEELREAGVAANTLWPRTIIATAAVQNLLGGDEAMSRARTPRDLRRLGLRDPHQAGARVHRPGADRRRGAGRRRRHRPRALPRRGGRRRADRRPVRGPGATSLTRARYRRAAPMSIRRGSWTGWETSLRRGSLSPCSPPAGRRAWHGRCGCPPSAPPGARSGSGCCCTPAGSTVYNLELSADPRPDLPVARRRAVADARAAHAGRHDRAGPGAPRARQRQPVAGRDDRRHRGGGARRGLRAAPDPRDERGGELGERRPPRLPARRPAADGLRRRAVGRGRLAHRRLVRPRRRLCADRHERRDLCRRAARRGLDARHLQRPRLRRRLAADRARRLGLAAHGRRGLADGPRGAADRVHGHGLPARRLRGVHRAGPGRRGDDPPHAARRRGPARPHAVVAVAPARRPRGARRLRPADRAGQLPRVPGAPAARGGRGGARSA